MTNILYRSLYRFTKGISTRISTFFCKSQLGDVGPGTRFSSHCLLKGDSLKNVTIGRGCYIDTHNVIECDARLKKDCEDYIPSLTIGNGCNFGEYNHITAVNRITIGDNLLTGRYVLISDNSHGGFEIDELSMPPSCRKIVSKGEVVIGDNVWIGDKASILPGVQIGNGCVIGANAVVTHNVPSFCMVAGNPARIIKQGIDSSK